MNINKESEIFIKNIIFGVGDRVLSVTNVSNVFRAVRNGYRDMQPRTFKKVPSNPAPKINKMQIVLTNLAQAFVNYFQNPPPNFDDWHKKTCDTFLIELNNLLQNSGYQKVEYGKAQKIVNVTFKYLYLFDDAKNYLHLFKDCHFILDGYTIQWYNAQIAATNVTKPWSDLDYSTYIQIQKDIKQHLLKSTKYPTNPFEAEFYIWAEHL